MSTKKYEKLYYESVDGMGLIREREGITQQKLSEMIEIDINKIKSIEIGKVKISSEIGLIIEEKFNYNFKWLLTGQGDMASHPQPDRNKVAEGIVRFAPSVEKHIDVVKQFKDQEKAIRINEKLVKLERISESQLDRVERKIDEILEIVSDAERDIKKTAQSTSVDRRVSKEPHNGQERRKAG